ncbi:PEP-CTERM sorting domain-containing protein [Aquabacterium sp. CECT 9606]|uniref:PEP-CTERM sorting domain-containing protein n=1 Tax=Aquabacterium sp. CECT 9606 TaxID=2845822 RepID=UPI001E5664A7|nr:PEP-CTERM sorting domain-containing protein [Aquabacterium sp. CECT 9606]CAH0348413.1 hypothetical protein AQB9606_00549 [Aquabacterium sp. CECT 9606]
MKKIMFKHSLPALACIAALAASSLVQAAPYLLHQDGFIGGGELNLTLEGVDLDQDGLISAWSPGEISQAFLTFSGNADIRDFASPLKSFQELLLAFKVGHTGVDNDPSTFQGVYITVSPDGERKADYPVFHGYFGMIGAAPETEFGAVGYVDSFIASEWRFGPSTRSRSLITVSEVPEPGTLLSMALGLATVAVYGRRQSS